MDIAYVDLTVNACAIVIPSLVCIIHRLKEQYKKYLKQDPTENYAYLVSYIKSHRDILLFYEAVVSKKSEYELHELKLKALHTDSIALEDNHKLGNVMNEILKIRKRIETIDVRVLGNS